jgi:hypothetical protein
MRRFIALTALLLAGILYPRIGTAQSARVATQAVVNEFGMARDSLTAARSSELYESLESLLRYQERFYRQHNRFTADALDVPEFRPPPGTSITVSTGGDWIVLNGKLVDCGIGFSLTAWAKDTPQRIVSGSFSR